LNRILILGASGFIGSLLYRELSPYFDVQGTYHSNSDALFENQVMHQFNVETDSITPLLESIQPNYIISSLRGDFKSQYDIHQEIINYVKSVDHSRLYFLSTVNVFDGKSKFPAYEDDPLIPESNYGKFKASVERSIRELSSEKYALLRLPMVLGVNSPRLNHLRYCSVHKESFEVFPNLIISVTTANKIAQQVHYLINKDLTGVYHLSSSDMIHHDELFEEIAEKLNLQNLVFKNVYNSNEDQYLAILPKKNKLPKNYRITVSEVINDITLMEEIETFKR
jgi:dTDP-4-dehydrorhamnose reductase